MNTSRQAFDQLLSQLAAAAEVVGGPLGSKGERERAEGYRHLTRLLSVALEMYLERGDPQRPEFTRWMDNHRKLFGDNPGTIYDAALISPDHVYEIAGTVGTTSYFGIAIYGTAEDGSRRIVGNVDDTDLTIGTDGSFRIRLGGEEPGDGTDWVPLDAPDVSDVMVRQYFHDRPYGDPLSPQAQVEGRYRIRNVADPDPPPPLTEDDLAASLDRVGRFVAETVEVEVTLGALLARMRTTPGILRAGDEYLDSEGNADDDPIDPSVVAKTMPSPAIQYTGSWYGDLRDDEAMVVEGRLPEARYVSIQLLSRFMESGDHRYHRVSLTDRDLVLGDPTGSSDDPRWFRVVVAHRDPGVPNWLDTTGIADANVAVRALHTDETLDIDFRRVPLDELG